MNRIEYYDKVCKKYNMTKEKRNFVLIGSPNHGNMGDIAITWSTIKLLERLYPNDNVFDITMDEFPYEIDAIFHLIKSQDIIILQGGGNLGNIYPDDEMIRRYVISRFKNNRIIIFPQSVYFSDNLDGKKELEICSRLYSKNSNLYVLARDKHSFDIIRKNFNVLSERIVDVVLTQKVQRDTLREGAMICLRGDKESILSDENKKEIADVVSSMYSKVVTTDTVLEFDGNKNERYEKLADKLDEFRNAELVVTDRLHGLIFSIITNTPCIVLPTVNTKITSTFEDLDMIAGISLIKSVRDLGGALDEMKIYSNIEYDNTLVIEQYRAILDKILEDQPIQGKEPEEMTDDFELSAYWDYKAYESEYWKNEIKRDYDSLQKNNEDHINEIAVYKDWVNNLETQKNEITARLETINAAYENQCNTLDDRSKELAEYKTWVANLQNQNDELKAQFQTEMDQVRKSLDARLKELVDYKSWVVNLQVQNDELKTQWNQVQKSYLETQEQLTISQNKIKGMKDEESSRQRQFNIQLRELYNNVKNEREDKIKITADLEEKIRNQEKEKKDLEILISQLENEKKGNRGIFSKTLRCMRLYGIRHTIRSCVAELKKK